MIIIDENKISYLGDSISGTCRKLLLFGFWGECNVGTARANSSATGTCGDPKPVCIPYSISWKTLKIKIKNDEEKIFFEFI